MLDLIATKTTINDASSTAATFDMPAGYASGNLLVLLLAIGSSGTISSGAGDWTEFGTASSLGGRKLFIYRRVADGTEATSYTFNLSGSTVAVAHVMAWSGQHGTPLLTQASADRVAFTSATSVNSPASMTTDPAGADAWDDCAIIHAMVNASGSTSLPSVEDDSLSVTCNETAVTSTRLVVGYTSQAAAGAIPQINWLNGASQSGLVATLAIVPASADGIPPKASTPLNAISKPGYSATTYGSLAGTITSLSGVNINLTGTDYPAGTISATTTEAASIGSLPDGGITLQLADYHQTSTATVAGGEWVGAIETLASPVSYDGKLLSLQFATYQNSSGGAGGKGGTGYIFADTSLNWAAFAIQDFVDLRINNVYCNHIACGGLTPDDESGTGIDWTDVKYRGLFYNRNNSAGGTNTRVYSGTLALHGAADIVFVGGSALRPIGHQWTSEYFEQFRAYKDFEQFQGSRQLIVKMGMTFGDGTTPTYVDFSQGSVETPTADTQYWRGTTDSIELAFVGGADDTFDWRAGVFRANTPQKWTLVSDAGASWLHAAASWIGPWDWDNQADVDFTNATWSGCRTVKLGAADHSLLTISGTAATGSGSAAASADGNGSLSDSTLDGTGAEYALELGTAVTAYSLTDCPITTGSTAKIHVLATTGTVTITISGSTVSPTYVSAGAAVDISAPVVTADISITGMPDVDPGVDTAPTRLQIINTTAISAADWTANTSYATGDVVLRTSGIGSENTAGLYFRATTGGTSHVTTEPTWDTTVGNTTTDGTVVWTTYAILYYDSDPAATSLTDTYIDGEEFKAGEVIEIRFAEEDPAVSFKTYSTSVVAASTGFSALVNETDDSSYATYATSGVTQDSVFSPNFVSNYIVLDTDTNFTASGAYAYYCYLLTTSEGMYRFWGGLTGIDPGNIRNNVSVVSLYFDCSSGFVRQTDDIRIFRSDGLRPALDPVTAAGGGIEINWKVPVNVVTTGGSAVLPQDIIDIADAVRTELTTELTQLTKVAKLHAIDATLVVTPTTRTAGSVSQTISTVGDTTTVT